MILEQLTKLKKKEILSGGNLAGPFNVNVDSKEPKVMPSSPSVDSATLIENIKVTSGSPSKKVDIKTTMKEKFTKEQSERIDELGKKMMSIKTDPNYPALKTRCNEIKAKIDTGNSTPEILKEYDSFVC